jgi:hypothetical protein
VAKIQIDGSPKVQTMSGMRARLSLDTPPWRVPLLTVSRRCAAIGVCAALLVHDAGCSAGTDGVIEDGGTGHVVDAGGVDSAASDRTPDPTVRIIRGDDELNGWSDLTVIGAGLDVPDGTIVLIQIGIPDRPPERLGLARTTLTDGGFSVHFKDVWELGLYKKKVVFADLDGDGVCTDADLAWVDYSAFAADMTLRILPPDSQSGLWGAFLQTDCSDVVPDWPLR